jgi:hypothetical protein
MGKIEITILANDPERGGIANGKSTPSGQSRGGELDCVGGWVVGWLKHKVNFKKTNRGDVIRNKRRVLEHGVAVMSRDTTQ